MAQTISKEDLNFILKNIEQPVQKLKNERLLLTGATGFFGKWLTQSLLAANDTWDLNISLTLVSRNKERALQESPWLTHREDVQWIETDIRKLSSSGNFTTIIHGAAAASRDLNENHAQEMFDTILDGTRQILKLIENGTCKRLLFISSGAVYGRQPETLSHVSEDYFGAPDPYSPQAAYGEAKRAAEFLCAAQSRSQGFAFKVARCFAFVGPYLPLEAHFAAGNFISQVLKQETITIGGDGSPIRSYLYAADLVIWLVKILIEGKSETPYNVGSDHSLSIHELAQAIDLLGESLMPRRALLKERIHLALTQPSMAPKNIYVPSIERAKRELGLEVWTSLQEAFLKTLQWHLQ